MIWTKSNTNHFNFYYKLLEFGRQNGIYTMMAPPSPPLATTSTTTNVNKFYYMRINESCVWIGRWYDTNYNLPGFSLRKLFLSFFLQIQTQLVCLVSFIVVVADFFALSGSLPIPHHQSVFFGWRESSMCTYIHRILLTFKWTQCCTH